MAPTTPPKDTIYIDIDDEITGIIDKLRTSEAKIVALVLPKRASVFQSIVNMKLLKRAADDDKKHLVLITTEAGLLPLAGLAGVLVASSLTSKPTVPVAPIANDQEETVDEATGETETDPEIDGNRPIGELAGLAAAPTVGADGVETIDMSDEVAEAPAAAAIAQTKAPKLKKDNSLAVPNFERFRLLLIFGALLLVALIAGAVFALTALPKAAIAITTDATTINTNLNFTADTKLNAFNAATHALPAKAVTQQKVYTQQTPATGQKNNGEKATGQIKITNCSGQSITVPAGTGFSSGNYTFISQNAVEVNDSDYTKSGACKPNTGVNIVNVRAQNGGASYNLAADTKYSVAGQDGSTVTSTGAAMTGGTDNITKIVSQADVDNAKAKINTTDPTVKQALSTQLVQTGSFPLAITFTAAEPAVTTSSNVGDAADSVTVTETVNYSMLGVQQSDLKTLVDDSVKKQIDTSKQSILDEGLRAAVFTTSEANATTAQLTVQTVAEAGPQLSVESIKKLAAGKKIGDIQTQLRANPDVTGVTVKLSPFFVSTVPKKLDKITVTIAKPRVTTSPAANGNQP